MRNVMLKYVVLCMIMFSFLSTYLPNTSYACSCVPPDSVHEELERHTAVFSGKVVKMVDENKFNPIQSSADPIAVVFEVNESWKGINQTEVVVYTERDSASCGYEFSLNNEYVVYANELDGELRVSLCSRTAMLSEAVQDIEELGKGDKPTENGSVDLPGEDISATNNLFYIYLIVITLLLVGVHQTIARYHKK